MQPTQTTKAPEKKKRRRLWLSVLFLAALSALTFYIVFRENSLEEILAAFRGLNTRYVALAAALMIGYFLFQALALFAPLRSLSLKTPLRKCVGFSLIGFFFSGITPSATGGQPMQLYYMSRAGIPVADGSLALLCANILYQIVVMLYGIVMLVLRFRFVSGAVSGMTALIIYGYVITTIVLLALMFVTFSKTFARKVVGFIVRVLAKLRIVKDAEATMARAEAQLSEYARGAAALRRNPKLLVKEFLYTAAQMTCYFLVPFCIYKAFGLSGYALIDLLAVQSILFIAVSYLPLPGAMGASEKGFVSMFSLFFSAELVVPAMLLSRSLTFYLPLLLSAAVTFAIHLQKPAQAPALEAAGES